MSDSILLEDVEDAKELLHINRRTLAIYLKQYAVHGAAHVPPSIVHGIDETRAAIQHIKTDLRNKGEIVEDQQNDFKEIVDTKGGQGSEYYKEQFKAYVAIWDDLQEVAILADKAWKEVTEKNVINLQSALYQAQKTVGKKSLFFDGVDSEVLETVLENFSRYSFGKDMVYRLSRRNWIMRTFGLYSRYDRDIRAQIERNRHYKDQYEAVIESIRIKFKKKLSEL